MGTTDTVTCYNIEMRTDLVQRSNRKRATGKLRIENKAQK